MLSLAKVRRTAIAYYLASLPAEEGRAGLVEEDGTFVGRGARRLGIEGARVSEALLESLFAARHPLTGEALSRRPPAEVVAFDCTFSTPKAVSLLEALAEAPVGALVRSAHRAAVGSAVAYLERHAASVRRVVGGERRPVAAAGLAAAAFLHRTSRALDPHLHTHLLVVNLGSDADGNYSALDARPLFAHLDVAGALYEAEVRSRLSAAVGVAWRVTPSGGLDLVGVPDGVAREFSRRRAQIEEELRRSGRRSSAARRVAAQRTRPPKDRAQPVEELVAGWRDRSTALGAGSRRWQRVAPARSIGHPAIVAEAVAASIAAMDVPFTRATLLALTARALPGGATIRELEVSVNSALERDDVRALDGAASGRVRFTTRAIEDLQARLDALGSVATVLPTVTERTFLPTSGLVLLAAGPRGTSVASALAALGTTARREGRPVRAFGLDVAATARLHRQLGLRDERLATPVAAKGGGILVLGEPRRWRRSQLVELMERSLGAGGLVVAVGPGLDGPALGRSPGLTIASPTRTLGVERPFGRAISA